MKWVNPPALQKITIYTSQHSSNPARQEASEKPNPQGEPMPLSRPKTSITREIAQTGHDYQYDMLPAGVATMAKHCFLDWLGVTIAGAQDASAALLRAVLAEEGAKPVATFLGTQTRGSIRGVAEGNGTAAHALDFDDLHVPAHLSYGAIGHPSAPVIAALLALAEANAVN